MGSEVHLPNDHVKHVNMYGVLSFLHAKWTKDRVMFTHTTDISLNCILQEREKQQISAHHMFLPCNLLLKLQTTDLTLPEKETSEFLLWAGATYIITLYSGCNWVVIWVKLHYSSCIWEQRMLYWFVPFLVPITDDVRLLFPNLRKHRFVPNQ